MNNEDDGDYGELIREKGFFSGRTKPILIFLVIFIIMIIIRSIYRFYKYKETLSYKVMILGVFYAAFISFIIGFFAVINTMISWAVLVISILLTLSIYEVSF